MLTVYLKENLAKKPRYFVIFDKKLQNYKNTFYKPYTKFLLRQYYLPQTVHILQKKLKENNILLTIHIQYTFLWVSTVFCLLVSPVPFSGCQLMMERAGSL